MTVLQQRRTRALPLVVLAAVLSFACEDEGPPEERVTAVEAAAGDQQTATVATQLSQPVVVRALDAQMQPVRGARVEWEITTGGGTITAVTDRTDEIGQASANWTLGTGAGEQTATARIRTSTVTFRATGVAGAAETVTVTPETLVLDAIGATETLEFEAVDEYDNPIEDRQPTWSSSATGTVTVSQQGVVMAVAPGSATVTATLEGVSDQATIEVDPQPASVVVTPATPTLTAIGATIQMQAEARDANGNPVSVPASQFTWSSSTAVATVSTTGLVTAQGNGTTQIRATLGTITGETTLTVLQAATTIMVIPQADTLTTAMPTLQMDAAARDSNGMIIPAPSLTWASTNTAIATVAPTGLVSAVSNGQVWIRVTSGTARDSARITVLLNRPPVAVLDTVAAAEDTQLVLAAPGLLANDTLGIPGGSITSFGGGSLGGTVTLSPAGGTVMFGTGGSLTVNANGSLTFMPSAGFTGSFTFLYRLSNVAGASDATVVIRVDVPPGAVADAYSVQSGMTLTVAGPGVRMNDTLGSPQAAVISYGGGTLPGNATTFNAGQTIAFGVGGFLRVDADGGLSFTPPTGYLGPFTLLYRLSNGAGFSDGTVTITVMPAPAPEPVPEPEPSLREETPLSRW